LSQLSTTRVVANFTGTATHLVCSENRQYLAFATTENKIHIWRAQYNGGFEQHAQLAGYEQKTIITMQFNTVKAFESGQKRVILLVLYNDDLSYHLHTYDILTQQEIREPVLVIKPHIRTGDLLVDISGDMQYVVSAARGASTVNVVNPLNIVTAVTRRFQNLKYAPTSSTSKYHDAVELFKQHPAVAFQPLTKLGSHENGTTLIEYALDYDDGQELLSLLDPDKPVLEGRHHNIDILSC
jgi:hypothetical protein